MSNFVEESEMLVIAAASSVVLGVNAYKKYILDSSMGPYVNKVVERNDYMNSILSNDSKFVKRYKYLVENHKDFIHNGGNQPQVTVDSRFTTYFEKELKGFNELLNKSGFEWDYMKSTVSVPATCWDELLSDKDGAHRETNFIVDHITGMRPGVAYLDLELEVDLFSNYSIGGVDTEDINDVYCPDMSRLMDEDEHLEDIEENPSVP
ncbi:hypothetical protein GIB67_041602 [Kingdonia uniflora]|uniref:Myb/SANT-like domain-containing protein n=1 Tax=Kingdonia uniflora TaxID=39325 RepID=A0A7J7MQH9_9MAGN|nr:hypothetical protein GIB67_041602 [Kingdonia uniflora]